MANILIIDDDKAFARSLQLQLEIDGHDVQPHSTGAAGLDAAANHAFDVILLDLKLRETDGLSILRSLEAHKIDVPVIMITGEQDTRSNIEAIRLGVVEYLRKPFDIDDLRALIAKACAARAASQPADLVPLEPGSESPNEIVGRSPQILDVIKQIGLLSRSQVSVLIRGESGTGKEVAARALHQASTAGKPFIPVNCTAIVGNLLESELFGHKKGSFTGADRDKPGMFELAADGTLFLDEIGDLPLDLQPKLLRVLQEREFTPLGGGAPVPFNARLVAATHRDLERCVEAGTFREDLFYRLTVTELSLPPLRERKGDIEPLVHHLLCRISQELHRPVRGITRDALRDLESYAWPGNVRELANVLMRAVALLETDYLTARDLQIRDGHAESGLGRFTEILPLAEVEKRYLAVALDLADWNISQAAAKLGITRNTLKKKIADYGLKHPEPS